VQGSWDLTVGSANGNGDFSGRLQYSTSGNVPGLLTFRKAGTGTQILRGDSSGSFGSRAGTVVEAGVLAVNNLEGSGLGSGALLVESAGTLAGHGIINLTNSNATIQGKLSVGNAGDTAGTNFTVITEGTMTFDGGTLAVDLFSGAGSGDSTANEAAADVLNAECAVELTGATLQVSNPSGMTAWAIGDKWKIANWASAPIGTFSTLDLPALGGGKGWDLSNLYSDGTIAVSAAVVQPTITITRTSPTSVQLTWAGGGVLQSASSVTGPYSDIAGANSPYVTTIGSGSVFFRVRMP
jgi:hypothetical protein